MSQKTDNVTQMATEGIESYLKMPNLLRDLLLQLLKDFQTAQIPLALNPEENYSFEGICEFIELVLEEHIKRAGTLKNLLNRVDLTEKQIKKAIPTALYSNLRPLTELIIKRELQKVVIRYWYQQSSNK
jgi:ethanolamine utilization protein EutA (predicted chaperonin)